jgi:CheY-like chemotaxis protein
MGMKKILVADDDAFYRKCIADFLRGHGIAATIVDCGIALVKELLARPNDYACILTDVHMEAMNGIEAAGMIRTRFEDLPIVMMTGDDCLDTEIQARRIGISYYLKKPFGRQELLGVITRLAPSLADDGHVENSYC